MIFLHDMLTKSALENPHKTAFVDKERHFTYGQVEGDSTRLANFLVSKGLNHGDRIGIFSTKNIEEIIAIFAVMKIGCIFVHINPYYKECQLTHVIDDCDIKVLLVNEIKAAVLKKIHPGENSLSLNIVIGLSPVTGLEKEYNNKLYYLEKILKESSSTAISHRKHKDSDAAAVIYTSGSTGNPKGIIVTHKIFFDSTVTSASVLENNRDDRLISTAPFSFDGALSQLFTAIFVGGTLVLQESNFPGDIVKTMINERITGFHAVPSSWRMLLQKHSPLAKHKYPYLRYISIIGEVFPRDDLFKLKSILNNTKIFMMYGTTEAFRSTFLHPHQLEKKPGSVGKAFPGVEITIVDHNGRICHPGEIGEIVHKGAFISPGYWNDPVKSREVFKGNSLYTGDLGKIDDEGDLYFIGRKDRMFKSYGYRINPEEIETCLYKMPETSEAAVFTIPEGNFGVRLKAVVSTNNQHTLTQRDVMNHCKKYLPYYMVPGIVEFRTSLPKTGTNKIDRSLLN